MKKITAAFIKYAPVIMAVSCSIKVLLWSVNADLVMNYVNLVLNIILITGFYIEGRYLRYCWKHRSLCRAAMIGYALYLPFLIFDVERDYFLPFAVIYTIMTLLICYTYKRF